jgi:hypothetical protein
MGRWTPHYDIRQRKKWKKICREGKLEEDLIQTADDLGSALSPLAYRLIKNDIHDTIRECSGSIEAALQRGLTLEQMALCIMRNYTGGRLETGWYHSSLGCLSPTGAGPMLRNLFSSILQNLVQLQFYSEENLLLDETALQQSIDKIAPTSPWPRGGPA